MRLNIPVTAIPQFVQEHAKQYPNPIDGKTMAWDAEKQQLFVELRHASNQAYQKSSIIRLSVVPLPEVQSK